jgi:hypothetical protein
MSQLRAVAVQTTICWTNKCRGIRLLNSHKVHGVTSSSRASFTLEPRSVSEFVQMSHTATQTGAMKSSHKSNIGHMSRHQAQLTYEVVYTLG